MLSYKDNLFLFGFGNVDSQISTSWKGDWAKTWAILQLKTDWQFEEIKQVSPSRFFLLRKRTKTFAFWIEHRWRMSSFPLSNGGPLLAVNSLGRIGSLEGGVQETDQEWSSSKFYAFPAFYALHAYVGVWKHWLKLWRLEASKRLTWMEKMLS